jgi:hypothetical protein
VKYLILIWSNPDSRQLWDGLSNEERSVGLDAYEALTRSLAASGELIVAEALSDASQTRRVHVREGRTLTTDGPFAEGKELLAGIILVECASIERAIAHAARVPEAELGLVEVRPVMDLSGFLEPSEP